jgi:hypothetical protein
VKPLSWKELRSSVARRLIEGVGRRWPEFSLLVASREIRARIDDQVWAATGGVVQQGPFAGMRLLRDVAWSTGDITPKLLGTYEEELGPFFAAAGAAGYDQVLDVGCAEGYYAVGAARLLTSARVLAYDIDPRARATCGRAARENGVHGRVEVRGACSLEELERALGSARRTLLIMDCEGCELDLIDPARAPSLRRADCVIECHDFSGPGTAEKIAARLEATHALEVIRAGARDPHRFGVLAAMPDLWKWTAVCEFRPATMRWVTARAR